MIDPVEAAESLATIERTQAAAFGRQTVPLWFFGGVGLSVTGQQFFSELDHTALQIAGLVLTLLTEGLLVRLLLHVSGARWRRSTWTRSALAVYLGWLTLCVTLGVASGLAFSQLGWAFPRTLGGLVATAACVATTRRMERLVLRLSVGRVNL
jgi:hypothetical protein